MILQWHVALIAVVATGCVKQNVHTHPLARCEAITAEVRREIDHPSRRPQGNVNGHWVADRIVGNMYGQTVYGAQQGARASLEWTQGDTNARGEAIEAVVMTLSGAVSGNVLYLEGPGPSLRWDWGYRPDTMLIDIGDGLAPYRARLEIRPDRIVGEMFRGCIARTIDLARSE